MKRKTRKDKQKYKNKIRKQQSKVLTETSEPDENFGITDKTIARMQAELSEQHGIEHRIVRDRTLEKMSDILLEYGKPFLDIIDTDNKSEFEKSIKISMILWNCAILHETGGAKERRKIEKMLKPVLPDAESKGVFKYMVERKRQMYPDNKRIILNYEISETPSGFHLSIASTIPKEKSEKLM